MHKRRIRGIVVFLFALIIAGTGVHSSAQDFANMQIQTEKIDGEHIQCSAEGEGTSESQPETTASS